MPAGTARRNDKISNSGVWSPMGFPSEPQKPEEIATAAEQAPQRMEMIPWHYQPPYDPVEQRRRNRREQAAGVKRLLKRFGALSSLSLFAYLALAVVLFLIMTPEIMRGLFSTAGYYDYLFVITPQLVPLVRMDGAVLVGYFMLVVLAITAAYAYIVLSSALPTIREAASGTPGRHSTMLTIGGLFFVAYFITYVNYLLIDAAGISPTTPDFGSAPVWDQIYGSATATVWEEIISRVLLIGVPLLWIDLLFRRESLLPPRRYLLGGGLKFGGVEIGLVVFSALMFGSAHVWSWDVWKITPTIIGGFCFGYLYLRFGLYASIMFHVCFNFLSVPMYFLSDAQAFIVDLVMVFVWLPAGVMFIAYYLLRLRRFLSAPQKKEAASG